MVDEQREKQLRQWIREENRDALRSAFEKLHPADAAEQLARLSPSELARYIELVGLAEALPIFEFVPFEMQRETLDHLPKSILPQLIGLMSPDDRADLVEELDEQSRERILSLLVQAERQELLRLITYPEGSAGAHMTTDYAFLRPDMSIRTALDHLRMQAPKKETIYYVYVVDQARRLIGFVSLRDLIMEHPERYVRDVMHKNVIAVKVDQDIEEVADVMSRYDFLAVPVVDAEQRLVGIITYDDIFDVMAEEATEDMYHLANLDTEEKITSPLPRAVRLRVTWLLINLCTACLAAYTVSLFSETIASFVTLASLMPIVAGMGGNAGTQSLTVVVRALALGELKVRGCLPILLKQTGIGLFCGLICGIVMAAITYAWHHNGWLSLILWMAMTANLVLAGFFGAIVPITLRKMKFDPALGSSVFVTTATDVGGFFTFLGLASLLLHHLLKSTGAGL